MQTCKVTWKVCSVQIAWLWPTRTLRGMSSGRYWTDLFGLAAEFAASRPEHPERKWPTCQRRGWLLRPASVTVADAADLQYSPS